MTELKQQNLIQAVVVDFEFYDAHELNRKTTTFHSHYDSFFSFKFQLLLASIKI